MTKVSGKKNQREERTSGRHSTLGTFTEDELKSAKWVKAIFGGRERMWVKVLEVCDGRITGTLDNEPVHVDMTLGQRVALSYAEVVDIMTP